MPIDFKNTGSSNNFKMIHSYSVIFFNFSIFCDFCNFFFTLCSPACVFSYN